MGATAAGRHAAEIAAGADFHLPAVRPWVMASAEPDDELITQDLRVIRNTMWNYVGLVRTAKRLDRASHLLRELKSEIDDFYADNSPHPAPAGPAQRRADRAADHLRRTAQPAQHRLPLPQRLPRPHPPARLIPGRLGRSRTPRTRPRPAPGRCRRCRALDIFQRACNDKGCSGIKRMRMNHHDDSQRSGRLVTQPVRPTLPPSNSLYENQLTAPADRPVRDPAHAVAFTAAGAIGGAGSVHRRTGMRAARALPGDRNRPGSPCPRYPRRCRPFRLAASRTTTQCGVVSRCRRPPSGRCLHDGARTRRAQRTPQHGTHPDQALLCVNCRNLQKLGVQNDTQRTPCARGVRGVSLESHAARCCK